MGNDLFVNMPTSNEKNGFVNVTPVATEAGDRAKMVHFGRRRTIPVETAKPSFGYDGEQNTVNTLGKVYTRIMNYNVVTRNHLHLPIRDRPRSPTRRLRNRCEECSCSIWARWSSITRSFPLVAGHVVGFLGHKTDGTDAPLRLSVLLRIRQLGHQEIPASD